MAKQPTSAIPTYSSNSLENALSKFAPDLWAVIWLEELERH